MNTIALLQAGGTGAFLVQILPIAAIFLVFYFIVIAPANKQRRKTQQMLSALKKGDRALLVWMCPAMRGPRAVDATSLACNARPLAPRDAVSGSRVIPEGCGPAVRSLPSPIRCVEESVRRRHTAGPFPNASMGPS